MLLSIGGASRHHIIVVSVLTASRSRIIVVIYWRRFDAPYNCRVCVDGFEEPHRCCYLLAALEAPYSCRVCVDASRSRTAVVIYWRRFAAPYIVVVCWCFEVPHSCQYRTVDSCREREQGTLSQISAYVDL